MPTYALKINGIDVATKGITVTRITGPWSSPDAQYEEIQIPGRAGAIRSTTKATVPPRDVTVTAAAPASTPEALVTLLDGIDDLCIGDVELIAGISTTRQYAGAAFLTSSSGTASDPQFVNGKALATLEMKFRLLDPYSEATSDTTVTSATATVPVAAPLGTKPSKPVITLTTATNPVVTYKGPLGETRGTFTITGTGTIVIDCDAMTITIGGVRHDEALTAGDFFEFACQSGEYSASSWGTIETSSGSLSVTYRKHYR